jgi:hypothetical protein
LSTKAWFALIGVALFSGLIGTYAFTWAMANVNYSSFGVMFLLLKLQPLFAILAALIFLWERPKLAFILFALLAIVSVISWVLVKVVLDMSFGTDVYGERVQVSSLRFVGVLRRFFQIPLSIRDTRLVRWQLFVSGWLLFSVL